MNGNDDFFGGSANPQPNPAVTNTREYANYSPTGVRPPVQSTTSPMLVIILVVVGALVAIVSLFGYRVMTSGTEIVLPDELLGMERVDPDSEMAQDVERSWGELETYVGEDVELHVGTYTAGTELLIVAAAETGVTGTTEQDEYFAGFSGGFAGEMPQVELTELDAGPHGGRMQCVNIASSGNTTGACTWIADDTFGVMVLTSPEADIAEATLAVREAIEQ